MSNYTLRLKRLSGFQHLHDELTLLPQFWILSVPYMFNLRCVHQAGGAVSFRAALHLLLVRPEQKQV